MNQPDTVYRILGINPGSTSTKIAVFDNEDLILEHTFRHSRAELDRFASVFDQKDMRKDLILSLLEENQLPIHSFSAIVGRGGLLQPIESGTYLVNDHMIHDLVDSVDIVHASAFGAIIAAEIAEIAGVKAYVVDPVVVDELDSCARLTGMPGLERRTIFHALNQKSVARRCARDMGKKYEDCRFIVAHMGGGVTIGAHRYGRVIDVNDALSGEGAFTPERTGSIPAVGVIKMCFSGAYTEQELIDKVTKNGGMQAYLGTNDLRKCEKMIREGDEFATLVLDSMAYQICKEIGAMYAVLEGRVDAIILTGGLSYSNRFTGAIKNRVDRLAPVKVYPGEDEIRALVEGTLRVLRGEEPAMDY